MFPAVSACRIALFTDVFYVVSLLFYTCSEAIAASLPMSYFAAPSPSGSDIDNTSIY
ncbi:hypothetical protein BFO_0910 [Tannerella forsythia 92A2]|uniref:Uncharacterized protein n=1 Tax=Tannerella forsythia (strain ATCC 43037 / JCM 10827 / CCUG 21028 A / KCTC 5666 / FDC 338) TaxID=203275 RepID=G8UPH4_TANFA|nr:hypothetical protein BFO_0910 [Tannerella forsythia 92A2]